MIKHINKKDYFLYTIKKEKPLCTTTEGFLKGLKETIY